MLHASAPQCHASAFVIEKHAIRTQALELLVSDAFQLGAGSSLTAIQTWITKKVIGSGLINLYRNQHIFLNQHVCIHI
jgi:hypothetical protein